MSYILDALKKSERERTLVRGLGFGDAGRRLSQDTDWLLWLIAGIAIVTLAVVVTTLIVRGRLLPSDAGKTSLTAAAPVAPAVEAPAAKPVDTQAGTVVGTPARNLATQAPPASALTEASVEAPTPAAPLAPAVGEAKLLTAMSPEFQQSVPGMTVNIHVYAPDETQRILYINNQQFHRGNEIPGGVVVEEITPEGVVLQFRGQRFKLPRPS
jgi:general secretion pathway protein B